MLHRIFTALASWLILYTSHGLRAQERYFNSNGVKLHYTVQGQGEPIVLIHGFAANPAVQWVLPGITAALEKNYCVISLDCRGHGQSEKPRDPKLYGKEMVEDVVRLLDHLEIKKAHLVGYSMGGFITLKMLTSHPDRILTATTGGAGLEKKLDAKFLDELAQSLDEGKGIGPLLLRLAPPGKPKPTPLQLRLNSTLLSVFNDQKALAAVVRGLKELALTEEVLKANKVPTLALVGALDPLKEGVDNLKRAMPDLKVLEIPKADHMNAFAFPEFARGLQDFLTQHPEQSPAKNPSSQK